MSNATRSPFGGNPYYGNPNILDNGCFVGGGSQQGGGQLPINQRGKTEGDFSQMFIDRWKVGSTSPGSSKISFEDDGIILKTTEAANYSFAQWIEGGRIPNGSTVCASILAELIDGTPPDFTIQIGDYPYTTIVRAPIVDGLTNISGVVIPSSLYTVNVLFTTPSTIKIKAIKLELGSQQTLAHKEGDKWVLNEIPNYAEELAKCQRYYWKSIQNPGTEYRPPCCVCHVVDGIGASFFVTVHPPVPMRITPTARLNFKTFKEVITMRNTSTNQTCSGVLELSPIGLSSAGLIQFSISSVTQVPNVNGLYEALIELDAEI